MSMDDPEPTPVIPVNAGALVPVAAATLTPPSTSPESVAPPPQIRNSGLLRKAVGGFLSVCGVFGEAIEFKLLDWIGRYEVGSELLDFVPRWLVMPPSLLAHIFSFCILLIGVALLLPESYKARINKIVPLKIILRITAAMAIMIFIFILRTFYSSGEKKPEHSNITKISECDHLLGSEDFIRELDLIGKKYKCPLPIRASRANFDKATVIWTYEPQEMFYFLYTGTNKWVPHNEPNSCDEPRCKANSPENRKYFEKLYGKIPTGKYPPFGGLTILMGDDASVFRSTGWGEWACDFRDNTVFYAEYDEGRIIGPFPTFWDAASDIKEHAFIIKNDGTYEVRTTGKTGAKCDNVFLHKP